MTDVNFDKLKVIFIDWYLTLTSVTFLNKLKVENHALFRQFINVIFENNPEGWQYAWARGKLSKEDAAQKISHAGIMPYEKVLQTFADCCSHQTLDYPNTFEKIDKLRQTGIKVVLATDNWDVFTDYTVPSLQLNKHFDAVLSSNQIGYLKRDEQKQSIPFFAEYLEKNNIFAPESLLIDDNALNTEMCQKHKLQSIKVQSTKDTLNLLDTIIKERTYHE